MKTWFLYCFIKKWFHTILYHFNLSWNIFIWNICQTFNTKWTDIWPIADCVIRPTNRGCWHVILSCRAIIRDIQMYAHQIFFSRVSVLAPLVCQCLWVLFFCITFVFIHMFMSLPANVYILLVQKCKCTYVVFICMSFLHVYMLYVWNKSETTSVNVMYVFKIQCDISLNYVDAENNFRQHMIQCEPFKCHTWLNQSLPWTKIFWNKSR